MLFNPFMTHKIQALAINNVTFVQQVKLMEIFKEMTFLLSSVLMNGPWIPTRNCDPFIFQHITLQICKYSLDSYVNKSSNMDYKKYIFYNRTLLSIPIHQNVLDKC